MIEIKSKTENKYLLFKTIPKNVYIYKIESKILLKIDFSIKFNKNIYQTNWYYKKNNKI